MATEPTAGNTLPDGAHTLPESKNTLMAILAYIGPLVIVSYLVAKDEPFVKFHIKQGLVLLVIEIAINVVSTIIWMFWPVLSLVVLGALVLSIVGIVGAAQGNEKELPIVGQFAKYFPI